MTTQYERDVRASAASAEKKLGLLEAAYAALRVLPECPERAELARQLSGWSLDMARNNAAGLRATIRSWDEELARKAKAAQGIDELPDAPARTRCRIQVGRTMGRWTDIGRCLKHATKIALVTSQRDGQRMELTVCGPHARQSLIERLPVAADDPSDTAEWYWRTQGICMARSVRSGDYCDVRVGKGTGKHDGPHKVKKTKETWNG